MILRILKRLSENRRRTGGYSVVISFVASTILLQLLELQPILLQPLRAKMEVANDLIISSTSNYSPARRERHQRRRGGGGGSQQQHSPLAKTALSLPFQPMATPAQLVQPRLVTQANTTAPGGTTTGAAALATVRGGTSYSARRCYTVLHCGCCSLLLGLSSMLLSLSLRSTQTQLYQPVLILLRTTSLNSGSIFTQICLFTLCFFDFFQLLNSQQIALKF